MRRRTNAEVRQDRQEAKGLFCRGWSIAEIAAYKEYSERTVRKWYNNADGKDEDWVKARQVFQFDSEAFLQIVRQKAYDLQNDNAEEREKAQTTIQEIRKLAATLKDIGSTDNLAFYSKQIALDFSTYMLEQYRTISSKKQREQYLQKMQWVHEVQEAFVIEQFRKANVKVK